MPSPQTFSFTRDYGQICNVIQTEVDVAQAFDPTVLPHPKHKRYNAIWDTGATATVISANVVKDHNLKPIDMVQVHTAGGLKTCEVFLVNVVLPNGVLITSVRVTLASLHAGCDMLVGMDIIGKGDLAVTNKDGRTVFSFRVPSAESIDFEKTPHFIPRHLPRPAVGRNSPCTCGSGVKYKRCCGK